MPEYQWHSPFLIANAIDSKPGKVPVGNALIAWPCDQASLHHPPGMHRARQENPHPDLLPPKQEPPVIQTPKTLGNAWMMPL